MKPWLFWVCLVAFFLDFLAIFVAQDQAVRLELVCSMTVLAVAMLLSTRR